jgi:redox-sensing transcriptional repressor
LLNYELFGEGVANIPIPVAMRLPLYHEYVTRMEAQGCRWISSNMIASYLDLTPSTIRQDIKYLGRIDSSSFGYNAGSFRVVLEKTLGISTGANLALVGIGSLGSALIHYKGFREKNFSIKALFDKREDLIDNQLEGITIYPVGRMAEVIKRERITIGVIATPADSAQIAADLLVAANIKGIWNFAPINLRVPPQVTVENVNLLPSLFTLAFKIKNS